MRLPFVIGAVTLIPSVSLGQSGATFLPASPTTVAWGYWSKAKPVLTVHSGDTVRIQTLSTCGPTDRLEARGIAAKDIPTYNAEIYDKVKDRGPGGHILTGPVSIAEAEPGDVLEVDIEKIDIDVPFACNGFSVGRGFLPRMTFPMAGARSFRWTARRGWPTSRSASRFLCILSSAVWELRHPSRQDATIVLHPGCTPATSITRNS